MARELVEEMSLLKFLLIHQLMNVKKEILKDYKKARSGKLKILPELTQNMKYP